MKRKFIQRLDKILKEQNQTFKNIVHSFYSATHAKEKKTTFY